MRALFLVALFASAVKAEADGCARDTDCKGDRVCEGRTCKAPANQSEVNRLTSAPDDVCSWGVDCKGDRLYERQRCIPAAAQSRQGFAGASAPEALSLHLHFWIAPEIGIGLGSAPNTYSTTSFAYGLLSLMSLELSPYGS